MNDSTTLTFDADGWPIYVPVLEPGDIDESTRDDITAFDVVYEKIFGEPLTHVHADVEYVICDAMAHYADRSPGFSMCGAWNWTWRRLGYIDPGPNMEIETS